MNLGYFGPPPPPPPPPKTGSTITLPQEQFLIQRLLPQIPQGTFYQRNSTILIVSAAILFIGIIGMVLLVEI